MLKFLRKTYLYLLAVPLLFTFLGAASNQIVLIANHDTFPVMESPATIQKIRVAVHNAQGNPEIDPDSIPDIDRGMLDETHCLMTEKTHLNFLADVFDLKTATYSIGDFLLIAGDWSWTFAPFVFLFVVIRKLTHP